LRPLTITETQGHLTDFGLDPSIASQTKIGGLSGGQKAKLVFAAAMWTKPHVLVLDEPTNYLDKETLDALKSALFRFKGACVVVSHNRDFVAGLCGEEWRVAGGRCKVVDVAARVEVAAEGAAGPAALTAEEAAAAAREEELAEAGAALLAAKAGGGGSSSGASWAAGTVTTANLYGSGEMKVVKDAKGRTLNKKEIRAMEKKTKDAEKKAKGGFTSGGVANGGGSDDDEDGDRKETAAEKKARRLAKKIAKEATATGSAETGNSGGGGKQSLAVAGQKAGLAASSAELDGELERAREVAARQRAAVGAHRGAVETEAFTLPNPGGGANLLEDSSFVLVPGRRYGLIGRNGTGARNFDSGSAPFF
jgi:ABC-type multidrug transport system ATPase subunit